MRFQRFLGGFVAGGLVLLSTSCAPPAAAPPVGPDAAAVRSLHDGMRKLWTDHVMWTRLYIVSAVGGLPDKELTTKRLLQNQSDIGNAVAGYFGKAAGDSLTALLKDHIVTAAALIGAAKAGDKKGTEAAKAHWYQNANDIAAFLSTANPTSWPLATLQGAMKTHLDQTLDEATHRLGKKTEDEIGDYDHIVDHILTMADMLSDGIVAKFPEKFTAKQM